jgi:alpha-tubulin suppressor-like RCC1 family protein
VKYLINILGGLFIIVGLMALSGFIRAQEHATSVQIGSTSLMGGKMGTDIPEFGREGDSTKGSYSDNFNFTYTTNGLWLEITSVSNEFACLNLHNATNLVYEIWSKTNLLIPNWKIEMELWPTDTDSMPFTISVLDRTDALFIWARDWTGVTSNGNETPEWWFWKYFGTLTLADTNLDSQGNTLLHDYQNGIDPDDHAGILPRLTIVCGCNQCGLTNSWLAVPLMVRLTGTNAVLLTNVPVTFTVVLGGCLIAASSNGMTSGSMQIRTGTDGQAAAWLQLPSANSTNVVIASAQSGTNLVQVTFREIARRLEEGSMMALGGERILELNGNGDVVSWGGNQYGELGDYTHLNSNAPLLQNNVPVHVVGLSNITKIASGLNHSLAIDSSGTLWAWGQNNQGQLGDGGHENNASFPVPVPGMTNTIAIAAHGYIAGGDGEFGLSLAVEADGTVWEWGNADGYGFGGSSPVKMSGISNVVSVVAGSVYALALRNDGTIWAWGEGYSDTPGQVSGLSNIVAVCAGGAYSLALDSNGVVWAWGNVPVTVAGLTNVVAVAAGASHFLALDGGGQLWAWGDDGSGQLGDGGLIGHTNLPMKVSGMSNIISIAAGSDASVALDGNGNLWQWGDDTGLPAMAPQYDDFYKGQLPNLTILNGNNQVSHAGLEFPLPLAFRVTDANGVALSNAPVSVEVIAGDMELRAVSGGDNYKGLRLTTDTNGGVFLIGYADSNFNNPACVVKVLAASRERIGEADFNETLSPPPTISITSPGDGGTYLIGTNRALTITVDAEAAPGASIQEVDYYYGTNGVADAPLGISTQSPYSFIWNNSLWWTNAFVGQYTLSAVAVDDAGAQSDPQSANITIVLDSDGNGMPDYWQLQRFGHLGVAPSADPDGDDTSNLQEFRNGTNPTDYYNGNLPALELLSGNDQGGNYDSFLPLPVTIQVVGANSVALIHAPVTFTVTNGTALLAMTTNDAPVASLALRTDTNGQVSVWVYFPAASFNPPDSTIVVSASSGANYTAVTVNEFVPVGHWTFNDTNTWIGEEGQLPLLTSNVAGASSWSSNAVLVDSASPARIVYNVVETNGNANINCQTGSVLFWFKPDWSSANTGGNGPGTCGRLIEIGDYNPAFTNGWWALYLSPDGTQLLFGTSTNGGGMTNLNASISWYSNEWYQIALTYSPTGSALYVDGRLLTNGSGVTCFPNADEQTNGFRIGSDQDGNNQAGGAFDELETFNYPLDAPNTYTHGSDIPDWWELKYFNQTGLKPDFQPAGDGVTLLLDYQRGTDPNVIKFTVWAAKLHVNTVWTPLQISLSGGVPFYAAVLVNDGNHADASWQSYTGSNVVATLGNTDGVYGVRVGLRGLSADAQQTWNNDAISFTLDRAAPVVAITNPATTAVSEPVIQVRGFVNKQLSSLTIDVRNAAGISSNQTGYVTGAFYDTNLTAFTTNYFQCYDVPLTNGVNTITLRATDLAGNMTATNVSFTLNYAGNTNPPVLTVVWPQDGSSISGSQFTFQGTVDKPGATITATIVANGDTNIVQGLVEQNGTVWVQNLPIVAGANTLTITATDTAGISATTSLTLNQSKVTVTMNPLSGDQLNQSYVNVTGTVSDPSCTVTVNDMQAGVNPDDGTWEADGVPVRPSGTAIFDVEVYSGNNSSTVVHPGLKSSIHPADAGNNSGIGSEQFVLAQPVKVGVMSYRSHYGFGDGFPNQQALDPFGQPASANYDDQAYWNYRSGGMDAGYYVYSGALTPWSDPVNDNWLAPLPAGQDNFNPLWEMASVAEAGQGGIYIGLVDFARWNDTETRVMLEPPGQTAAGTTNFYLVQAQASEFSEPLAEWINWPLSPDTLQICGATLTLVTNGDGSVWGQTLIAARADEKVEVTPKSTNQNYIFNVQAFSLDRVMAMDNNHNGQIMFDNSDATTPQRPFRLWINDSRESGDVSTADYAVPGSSPPNYARHQVNGRADVINFFPVAFNLVRVLEQWPLTNSEYHLSQAGNAVKMVYTALTPGNAFDYLNDPLTPDNYGTNFDKALTSADTIQVLPSSAQGTMLDTNWLAHVQRNNGGQGVILVEGCTKTTKPLVLEIWQNGQKVQEIACYISISGVEKMYRQINLRPGGSTDDPGVPLNYPDSLCSGKHVVFIHGFSVSGSDARGENAEMFKRLYQADSHAMFTGMDWKGDESPWFDTTGKTDYYDNVKNAFMTASNFNVAVSGLPGSQKYIIAHSLGNMVASSAIKDFTLNVNSYFALDAAVATEAYDGDNSFMDMVNPNIFGTFQGWKNYDQRLWASDWHNLFSSGDGRAKLTWINRFGVIGNIYNFYSSGENVLHNSDGTYPSPFTVYSTHERAWVCQEMSKGDGLTSLTSSGSQAGWQLNPYWYVLPSGGKPGGITQPRYKFQAALSDFTDSSHVNTNDLPANPFFERFNDSKIMDASAGSAEAAKYDVRADILGGGIPALSHATGANSVAVFEDRNFDLMSMETKDAGGNFLWPSARPLDANQHPRWLHSDFEEVAYPFNYSFYDFIVNNVNN